MLTNFNLSGLRGRRCLLAFFLGFAFSLVLGWPPSEHLEAREIETPPAINQRLSREASSAYWRGQYREAIAAWEKLLSTASAASAAEIHRYLGVSYRQVGQLGTALRHFKQASQFYQERGERLARRHQAEVLVERARTHNELGQVSRSLPLLEQALALIESGDLRQLQAVAYRTLGTAQLLGGDFEGAIASYQRSRERAAVLEQQEDLVAALNNLTNALLKRSSRYRQEALSAAAEGNESEARRLSFLAEQDGTAALAAASSAVEESRSQKTLSAARAMVNYTQLSEEDDYRQKIREILNRMPPSRQKASLLLNLAELEPAKPSLAWLEESVKTASSVGDWRTESFALGKLGNAYERAAMYAPALRYTQRAQWAAQQVMAADSLYRWQWQAGRIYRVTGQFSEARAAYRGASATLQKLRSEIASATPELQMDVRESVEPVYREFLSLLLRESDEGPELLREALEVRNQLQLTELQSFFGDACLELKEALVASPPALTEKTARIHSLILEDATYILLELPRGELLSYHVEIDARQLREYIQRWRRQLESSRIPQGYRDLSERLYDLLLRPMEPALASAGSETLIFVNDGWLRNVPMAALHDGKRFLIEKYSIASSLGLELSFPQMPLTDYRSLIFGLTVSVADFPPLPHVASETQQVEKILGGEKFLNDAFTVANLQAQINKNYPVVHLATHGEFGGTAERTFLQTFDQSLTLKELERILSQRLQPIELLTLSACDTAVGNERAVLGLAGVALRSGVKSVLASLWSVKDSDASLLLANFYENWRQLGLSKASSLQKAQLKLIAEPHSHPKSWAAFLLISG